jgi:hypothetical protein
VGRAELLAVLQGEGMLRKIVCASFVLVLCVGIGFAEELRGIITKVEGDKVTFTEVKGKEKGDTKTMPVDAKVKVVKGKFNPDTKKLEAGDAIEGGLKNAMFTKIGEKGVFATLVTDADNKKITEVRAFVFEKK